MFNNIEILYNKYGGSESPPEMSDNFKKIFHDYFRSECPRGGHDCPSKSDGDYRHRCEICWHKFLYDGYEKQSPHSSEVKEKMFQAQNEIIPVLTQMMNIGKQMLSIKEQQLSDANSYIKDCEKQIKNLKNMLSGRGEDEGRR